MNLIYVVECEKESREKVFLVNNGEIDLLLLFINSKKSILVLDLVI